MVLPFPSFSVCAVTAAPATLAQGRLAELRLADMPEECIYGLCRFLLQEQRPFYLTFFFRNGIFHESRTFQETFLFASIPLIVKVI